MKRKILIFAPHADDEVIGIGGTLLRHIEQGDDVFVVYITHPKEDFGFESSFDQKRRHDISECIAEIGLSSSDYEILGFEPATLSNENIRNLIQELKKIVINFTADTLYVPNHSDVHSDHYFVAKAADAISKSFRCESVKRVISYETISETDVSLLPDGNYKPNLYVNIEKFIEKKLALLRHYKSEMAEPPFPRNARIIKAHSQWRGSQAGYLFAEAHKILVYRLD